MQFARMGGRKRRAGHKRLQDKCQKRTGCVAAFLRGKSTSRPEISHGFELIRTVWCAGTDILICPAEQKGRRKDGQECLSYLFTVTLKVPTFPLLSKDLNDIVCSPGPSAPKSTV